MLLLRDTWSETETQEHVYYVEEHDMIQHHRLLGTCRIQQWCDIIGVQSLCEIIVFRSTLPN